MKTRSQRIRVYQLPYTQENTPLRLNLAMGKSLANINMDDFEKVYDGEIDIDAEPTASKDILEYTFKVCNNAHPRGYKGTSLTASDIVGLFLDGHWSYYLCRLSDFKALPNLSPDHE